MTTKVTKVTTDNINFVVTSQHFRQHVVTFVVTAILTSKFLYSHHRPANEIFPCRHLLMTWNLSRPFVKCFQDHTSAVLNCCPLYVELNAFEARLTRARADRSPRAARDPHGDSPCRSREAAPSSRLVAFQRLSRRETPGPRLRGSQTPESLPCQRNSPCRPRSRTRREPTRRRRRKKTPRNARESPTRAWCVPLAVPRVTRDRARAPPAVPPRRSMAPFP